MGVMQVSRKVDYALRAAIYLATQDLKKTCSSTGRSRRFKGSPRSSWRRSFKIWSAADWSGPKEDRTGVITWLDPHTRSHSRTSLRPLRVLLLLMSV